MLLPVHAAFRPLARTIEFRPFPERTVTRGTLVTRTLETRTILSPPALTTVIALAPGLFLAPIAPAEILVEGLARPVAARTVVALLPRLCIAPLAPVARTVTIAALAISEIALAISGVAVAISEVAFAISGVAVAISEVTVAAKILARPLGAAARKLAVVEPSLRTLTARGAIVAIKPGAVAARLEAALLAAALVALEARTIIEIAARRAGIALATRRAAVAVAPALAFAFEAALGEFLLRPARLAATAFGRASPGAGIVVFVAVARHE
jgi:hypothetical protein